jgi:hypothetical protein
MEQKEFNRRVNQDIQTFLKQGVVVIRPETELDHMLLDNNVMLCKHCGFEQQIKMGVTSFNDLDETFDKFQSVHMHCEKPVAANTRKPITELNEIAKQALTNAVNDGYHSGFDHGCDYILHEAEYWVRDDKGTLAEFVVYLKDFKKG